MNSKRPVVDKTAEEILGYEVSDEALEAAARGGVVSRVKKLVTTPSH